VFYLTSTYEKAITNSIINMAMTSKKENEKIFTILCYAMSLPTFINTQISNQALQRGI